MQQVERSDPLAGLEDDWRMLAADSDNVFATWEWQSSWWRHFGRDRELRVETVRDADGAVVALLPLYRAAPRPVSVARFVGHGPSDQLGPVCSPAHRRVAARALAESFASGALGCDLLIADELPADPAWRALGAIPLGRSPSPVMSLAAGADDKGPAVNTKLRAQLGRKLRRLERRGDVTFRTTRSADELDADLTALFALHEQRWRTTPGGSRAFAGRAEFHRRFAADALRCGWLRLRFIEVDGVPVSALYNLRYGDAESNYQAGRHPAYAAESVGLILHAHAVRAAAAEGATEYRFLRGGESYKERFTGPQGNGGLESFALARGPIARALAVGLRPVPALPRALRRRVPSPYAWGTGGSPVWGPP